MDLHGARSRSSASRRIGIGATVGCLSALAILQGAALAQPSFTEVAPIFEQRCIICHSGAGAPLSLRLDSYDGLMAGSANGPVVVPGAPDASELVMRIRGESLPRMPLTGPPFLDDEQIALIEAWVAAGACRRRRSVARSGRRTDRIGPRHA